MEQQWKVEHVIAKVSFTEAQEANNKY